MMDMEMNADLERDGATDSGEASTTGSSAGTIYCKLEDDFAKVTNEMKINDSLAEYRDEYVRLFEAYYEAQRVIEQLTEKCSSLQDELTGQKNTVSEFERTFQLNEESLEKLKKEIDESKKLADAAHDREQRARETIGNLRFSIDKLTDELEQKNKQLANEESNAGASKQKDNLAKERERLLSENQALKQRLKTLAQNSEENHQKLIETEKQMADLQEKFDRQTNELSRERREKEKVSSDFFDCLDELKMRMMDLQTLEDTLKTSTDNAKKQEQLLKDEVQENEHLQKEIQRMMLKQLATKTEADRLKTRLDASRKQLHDNDKVMNDLQRECNRFREEWGKMKGEKDNAFKKLAKVSSSATEAEENVKRLQQNTRRSELEIQQLLRQLELERKNVEKVGRERDLALQNVTSLEENNRNLSQELAVMEQTTRKMQQSLEEAENSALETSRQMKSLENERDRGLLQAKKLTDQLEDLEEELKLKQMEIGDQQKQLAEAEARLRKNAAALEEVRAERNAYKKNLSLTQDELGDTKDKLKESHVLLEQAKEELNAKEAELAKQEFMLGKTEKEKESLKTELTNNKKYISKLRHEMAELQREQKRLSLGLQEADATIERQKKDIESIMCERDVIGTQIVRRNDELALQSNKLQSLQDIMAKAEKQYSLRLDEIRMLKLELKKLKLDKAALEKNTANLADLRGEMFNLERRLTKERLKVTALEEEVQNPLNIHRWRKLEGTDPESYDLVKKVQLLQKRILKMSSEMIDKDKKIKELEKMYVNLREVLSKQPGPDVMIRLSKTRGALRTRAKKMKCLMAELNMTRTADHKFELDKIKSELNGLKAKCLAQKKRNSKANQELAKENVHPAAADDPSLQRGQDEAAGRHGDGDGAGFALANPKVTALMPVNQ
ncbi:hypothetical protein TKK_0005485 [Trichogramma kaykai]|uniref:Cilia- and flagella-associated protein 58 central coiled coil domain-containing protein n=1 Tax=Trichogramma kaykai TaxID=54128 RepID=A0ABD2XHP9_9HYME